jgi:peptide/nickel transport system substrate-binding protein
MMRANSKRRTQGRVTAASLVVLVAMTAACSSSGGHGATTTPTVPSSGKKSVVKGTMTLGIVGLKTFDPLANRDLGNVEIDRLLYQTLVGLNAKTSALEPGLAASWKGNAAQTTFTFDLAPNAQFHDGQPVTAKDVVATLTRAKTATATDPQGGLLAEVAPGGFAAMDAHTVAIALSAPDADFPARLTNPALGILPVASANAPSITMVTFALGSGPYRLSQVTALTVTLTAAQHQGAAVTGPRPATIVVHRYLTNEAAAAAYTTGEVEVTPVGPAQIGSVGTVSAEGQRPYLAVGYWGLNLGATTLADPRLRQAIVEAIDPAAVARAGYGTAATVAHGLVSSAVAGEATNPCAGICGPKVAAATAAVKALYPKGGVPTVHLDFDQDPTQQAMAMVMRDELVAAGIPAELRPHPAAAYSTFLASGGAELFRLGWVSQSPSASSFLNPLFAPLAPENVTKVASPAIAAAFTNALVAKSADARLAQADAMQTLVLQKFAAIPIVQLETRVAISIPVRGLLVDAYGALDVNNVTVTK